MPLRCWHCRSALALSGDDLHCPRGHRYQASSGVFDLLPPGLGAPRLDLFSSPYGQLYDSAIKRRNIAQILGQLGWGSDVRAMYRMMDDGVACASGQVVLDTPVGGGPALQMVPAVMKGTLIGLDLSNGMLQRAAALRDSNHLSGVILARGDATRLPLLDACVDRILCFNGLHVMPDKAMVLDEFFRVLKRGGELWGSVVVSHGGGFLSLPSRVARRLPFFHPPDPVELGSLAQDAGFTGWREEGDGALRLFRARKPAR